MEPIATPNSEKIQLLRDIHSSPIDVDSGKASDRKLGQLKVKRTQKLSIMHDVLDHELTERAATPEITKKQESPRKSNVVDLHSRKSHQPLSTTPSKMPVISPISDVTDRESVSTVPISLKEFDSCASGRGLDIPPVTDALIDRAATVLSTNIMVVREEIPIGTARMLAIIKAK